MTIKLSMPDVQGELKPRITVIGVGGAGGNAVNNMIESNLAGVEFLVCNTDAQALGQSKAERRLQLGVNITQGLGAGARPEVGRAAAEETLEEVLDHLSGSHMVFITAGMGGGTGTGATPVIARATREQGILTVGVVTKPFHFEGTQRMRLAESGIEELTQYVDTLIIIPNQNLFRVANEKTTFADAFSMADNVLYSGVRGVTDLMVMPGLINLDFADVRTVMSEMGKAMMGTGESDNDRRAIEAAEAAISNPLLDDITMEGARGVLINITGGPDMTLFEVDEAANRIREEVDPEANILFGSTFDESMEGSIRVSVVATGIDASESSVAPRLSSLANTIAAGSLLEPAAEAAAHPAIETAAPPPSQPRRDIHAAEIPVTGDRSGDGSIVPEQAPAPVAAEPSAPPPQQSVDEPATPGSSAEPNRGPAPAGSRTPFIPSRPVTPAMMGGDKDDPDRPVKLSENDDYALSTDAPVRRRSLFQRMTGVSRSREHDATGAQPPRINLREPPKPDMAPENVIVTPPAPAEVPAATSPATPENPSAQAAPAPIYEKPAQPAMNEEEVLDIPAFLRRQAN